MIQGDTTADTNRVRGCSPRRAGQYSMFRKNGPVINYTAFNLSAEEQGTTYRCSGRVARMW